MLAGTANGEGGAGKTKMQALGVAGERGRVKGCIRARRGLPGQSRGDARPWRPPRGARCLKPVGHDAAIQFRQNVMAEPDDEICR